MKSGCGQERGFTALNGSVKVAVRVPIYASQDIDLQGLRVLTPQLFVAIVSSISFFFLAPYSTLEG